MLAALLVPPWAVAAPFTVAGIGYDTDHAITRASITGGGYVTPHGTALPSATSADWVPGASLGTFFQRPTFQSGYAAGTPVTGAPGTAATLGQDPGFPATSQARDIIRLQWDAGYGLTDDTGADLAIFEAATSEAFAVRVQVAAPTPFWSAWFYTPYLNLYDTALDATTTQIDLTADFGLAAGVVINALEIANLIATDLVAIPIGATGFGKGQVYFDAADIPSGATAYAPGRFSTSQQAWVGFEAGKFDPDIQYVVAMRALTSGVANLLNAGGTLSAFSQPVRLAPLAPDPLPLPATPALLLAGLALLVGGLHRRPAGRN